MRSTRVIVIGAVIVAFLFCMLCLFVVRPYESVVVTRLGRIIPPMQLSGNLYIKLPPPIDQVTHIDNRIRTLESKFETSSTGDENQVMMSCFTLWKVKDPVLYFTSVGTEEKAGEKIEREIVSQMKAILGKYPLAALASTKPADLKIGEIEDKIRTQADAQIQKLYGVEITCVGIRRFGFPAFNTAAVYERMKAERKKEADRFLNQGKAEAKKIRARADQQASDIKSKGQKEALELQGKGDAEAAKIYSEAHRLDPEFYQFLQSLEASKAVLAQKAWIVLSPDALFLQALTSPKLDAPAPKAKKGKN